VDNHWLSTVPLAAFLVGHVVLAVLVSCHAVLHKEDVRSAFGWIGLAWLSPVVGPALYWAFGINRVSRRATRLRRQRVRPGSKAYPRAVKANPARLPEPVAAIARVSEIASETPLTEGNSIEMLHGGDEAYPAMIEAIRRAEVSIALVSYIFRGDRVGKAFISALAAAEARGVEVRVLLDGFGCGYLYSSAARRLAAAGVPVRRFLHYWMPWRMPFLNMRNHKKLLIVDGRHGFTGGLNIGVENLRAFRPPQLVRDLHFRISGPVVRQMMVSFAEDWSFTTGERLEGDSWWPTIEATGSLLARGISSGPDEDAGTLDAVFAAAVGAARQRLRIVTPYFLPGPALAMALALAALRGVEVDVILPERSDSVLLDWAMRAHIAFLKVPGLKIHLLPGPFDHSKVVTVDGIWSLIGSANWDVRSTRLNFEFVVECYDQALAGRLDRLLEEKRAAARLVSQADMRNQPMALRLRNAAARLLLPYL
jgi:cardiolipin synthase